ncbi:MAG: hypothetical protein WCL34_11180 [Methylococcaceae bacterium]
MNYWHMNLHPTGEQGSDDDIKKIILGLTIGMGIWDEGTGKQQRDDFKNRMNIGDVVAVLNGRTPIALVEVIGDWYEFSMKENGKSENSDHLDKGSIIWFPLRRAVKILNLKEPFVKNFPMRTKTLTISSGKKTKTYEFITKWHEESVC